MTKITHTKTKSKNKNKRKPEKYLQKYMTHVFIS